MKTLNEDRLKEILLCVLAQITDHSEMSKETYLSWLKLEVGISNQELEELNREGFLPMPMEPYAERE